MRRVCIFSCYVVCVCVCMPLRSPMNKVPFGLVRLEKDAATAATRPRFIHSGVGVTFLFFLDYRFGVIAISHDSSQLSQWHSDDHVGLEIAVKTQRKQQKS